MADTLYTPDGKLHVILGAKDVNDLIRKYMGDDIFRYTEYNIDKRDKEIEELRTELEFVYDDNSRELNDIKDALEDIRALMQKDRIDKKRILNMLDTLYNEVIQNL